MARVMVVAACQYPHTHVPPFFVVESKVLLERADMRW